VLAAIERVSDVGVLPRVGDATVGLRSWRPIPGLVVVAASRLLRSASVELLLVVVWSGASAFGYRRTRALTRGAPCHDEIIK